MALSASTRFPECVRSAPRSHRRNFPLRSRQHPCAPPAPLCARNHGAGDHLAHAHRLARGPGSAGGASSRHGDEATELPPGAGRLGRHRHPAAPVPLHRRAGRNHRERCTNLRVWRRERRVGLRRRRLRQHDRPPARRRPHAPGHVQRAARDGRNSMLRPYPARRGRLGLCVAVLGRRADHLTGRGPRPA